MNPPLKRRIRKPKSDRASEEQRLRAKFNVISQAELAILWGVNEKTLQNRDPADLPPFTRCGSKRIYFMDDVTGFMRKRMNV